MMDKMTTKRGARAGRAIPMTLVGALAAALTAGGAQAAVSLSGQTLHVSDSGTMYSCCNAPAYPFSRTLPDTVIGVSNPVGFNYLYGISGAVYVDPYAQRLWFTITDVTGFGSFANWQIHLSLPNLHNVGELTAMNRDPDVGDPLRYVWGSAAFGADTIDLTFNGTPATRGSFSYAWRYQTKEKAPAPPPTSAVPEPAIWLSLILGFGAAGGALRRRRGLPGLS